MNDHSIYSTKYKMSLLTAKYCKYFCDFHNLRQSNYRQGSPLAQTVTFARQRQRLPMEVSGCSQLPSSRGVKVGRGISVF